MNFAKILYALLLVLWLVSCVELTSPEEPKRGDSCVLDAGDYAIRVRRGASELEFVAPENVRGVVVRFGEDGSCVLDTTCSLGRGADPTAQTESAPREYPGVVIPVSDGRGYRDWLVLAYPEDYAPDVKPGEDGALSFEQGGASYAVAPDGRCAVTRDGLTRTAMRTDE